MHDFFTHPELLLALLTLPVLSILSWLTMRRRQQHLRAFSGTVHALMLSTKSTGWGVRLISSLGLLALVLGMAGPRWGRDWSQSATPGRDLVVVLDQSRSMFAESPSRLERACHALIHLIETLQSRGGGHRLGLVLFAGKAKLVCPLTHDLTHFRECVENVDLVVPDASLGGGTRIGLAVELALESFEGRSAATRDILVISDGDDPARDGEWQKGIARARREQVRIHCLGIGDAQEGHRIPVGSGWLEHMGQEVRTRLEEAPLRSLTQQTGGQLFLADMRPVALGELYLERIAQGPAEESPDLLAVPRQRPEWFLLGAFVLLALPLVLAPRGVRP